MKPNAYLLCRLACAVALACVLGTEISAADFHLSPAAREKIETAAQRMIDEQQTPGIAIGIMQRGEVIYAKGFGSANLESSTPVTRDSVFQIGSNTKQFTAVAIMALVEQGKLTLDDKLSKFFPDFPRGGEVTLLHLLTHSSGIHPVMIPGGLPTPEQRATLRAASDLVPIIQGQPNLYDFDPGTSNRYSNSGYILLGVIIEKVSGLSLGEFFKHHLFTRAGMTASALDDATEVVPQRAAGYNRAPGRDAFINPPRFNDVGTGGGGIRSTVGDMLRWQDALRKGRVISLESVTAMTTSANKSGRPFGVMVGEQNGYTTFSTGGGGPGHRSTQKMFPDEDIAFVVMINLGAPQTPSPAAQEPVIPLAEPPAGKKKGPGKKGGVRPQAQNSPNPVRELEQLLSGIITERE